MHPMTFAPPPLYGLDIETDTTVDGLDALQAGIVAVALSGDDGDEVFLGTERDILRRVDRRLAELPSGVIVTWNGRSFDLPFIAHRSQICGVDLGLWSPDPAPAWPPPDGGARWGWGAHRHLDGLLMYRSDVRRVLDISCGLKSLALLMGLAPVQVDYESLHELPDEQMAAYVASDARLARDLVRRRLPAAMAWADLAGSDTRTDHSSGFRIG